MTRKSLQHAYTVVLLPAGYGVYALLLKFFPPTQDALALGLLCAVLFVLFGMVNLVVDEEAAISPEMGAIGVAFLTGGPGVAAVALGLGSIGIALRRRRKPLRVLVTAAQYGLCLGALTAIFGALTGWRFGLAAVDQMLLGDWGFSLRYLLGVVLGSIVYVTTNVLVLGEWIRAGTADGKFPFGLMLRSDLRASLTFAVLSIPVAVLVGRIGWALTIIFGIPAIGVIWAGFQFPAAGDQMTVARRLTAFFTAAIGLVFITMATVVLLTFSGRYGEAVEQAQVSLARAYLVAGGTAQEEAVEAGANGGAAPAARAEAATSPAAAPQQARADVRQLVDSAMARLMAGGTSLAYGFLDDPAAPGPTALHVAGAWTGDTPAIEAELGRQRRAERRAFHFGEGRALRVAEVAVPVGSAELRLGVDMSPVEAAQRRLGLTVGGATLLLFLLLLLLLRYYLRTQLSLPLGTAGAALRGIAEGEADLSRGLPVVGDREIAELGRQFNRFVGNLAELVGATSSTAGSVVDGSQELAATSEELAASASQVSSSIEQAVGRMEQEREQTQTLQQLTSVLASLNSEVTEATLQARREAAGVVTEVERSREGIGRAGEALLAVRQVVQEADEAGGELIRASGKIGDLVQVIRDIAARTNLLALNAAIEAARAGDHGRGFAVVADEVRKLADGSARAANEAGELVLQITTRADELGGAMRRGAERVEGVERTAADSDEAMRLLVESVHRIDHLVGDIAERMVRERDTVAGVDAQVGQIQLLVRENADMAGQVGAAAQEQTASTEQMTQLSTSLAQHAQELQELVARFQVEERRRSAGEERSPQLQGALAY